MSNHSTQNRESDRPDDREGTILKIEDGRALVWYPDQVGYKNPEQECQWVTVSSDTGAPGLMGTFGTSPATGGYYPLCQVKLRNINGVDQIVGMGNFNVEDKDKNTTDNGPDPDTAKHVQPTYNQDPDNKEPVEWDI